MQPPPSRYKVVERGRRLEVIDTRTGKPASRPPEPGEKSGSGRTSGAGIDADVFVTKRWFDDKAPRTIRLNYANRARLLNLRWVVALVTVLFVALLFWFWPLAIMLAAALAFGPKLRAQLRVASTSWIDGLDKG